MRRGGHAAGGNEAARGHARAGGRDDGTDAVQERHDLRRQRQAPLRGRGDAPGQPDREGRERQRQDQDQWRDGGGRRRRHPDAGAGRAACPCLLHGLREPAGDRAPAARGAHGARPRQREEDARPRLHEPLLRCRRRLQQAPYRAGAARRDRRRALSGAEDQGGLPGDRRLRRAHRRAHVPHAPGVGRLHRRRCG